MIFPVFLFHIRIFFRCMAVLTFLFLVSTSTVIFNLRPALIFLFNSLLSTVALDRYSTVPFLKSLPRKPSQEKTEVQHHNSTFIEHFVQ